MGEEPKKHGGRIEVGLKEKKVPLRRGEIPRGAFYEATKKNGGNPHVNAARRNKYADGPRKKGGT